MTAVVIAWISPGQIDHQFMDSVIGLIHYDSGSNRYITRPEGGTISMISSPRIAEARSQVVERFATGFPEADWLLMVDADMTFGHDLLERMLEHADPEKVPVLGGLCFGGGRGTKIFPTVYEEIEVDGKLTLSPTPDYPRDALVKVGGTGAACMLVHRQVFAAMARPWPKGFGTHQDGTPNPYPWFVEGLSGPDGAQYGEDIAFCKRARMLGIPIHVHTGIKLGHMKRYELTEAVFDEWLAGQGKKPPVLSAGPNRAERRRARKRRVSA